jgi:DNA-binding CsgD family transcriptional regulator
MVVVIGQNGRVRFAMPREQRLLAKYVAMPESDRVPPDLERRLRRLAEAGGLGHGQDQPLVIQGSERCLMIHGLLRCTGDESILLLVEEKTVIESLKSSGLTPREAEVVSWLTEGRTNREIGTILGISARTVQVHLNRIYRKLGVETRTAAAVTAFGLARSGLGSPGLPADTEKVSTTRAGAPGLEHPPLAAARGGAPPSRGTIASLRTPPNGKGQVTVSARASST